MNKIIIYFIIALLSIIYTELIGYLSHRFFVHDGLFSDKIRATHYCHHEIKYPYYDFESERYRLANDTLPWAITITIFAYIPTFILFYKKIISKYLSIYLVILFTIHLGFISYIHDSYHYKNHWLNKYEWYRKNRYYHYIHHLDNVNYGITNYFFDKIFGTFSDKKVKKQDNFNGLETTCEKRYKIFDDLPSLVN